ncbi:MAG: hypothetical protein L0Y35_01755, partial [Flammeovirgaceae bacterium]|nr:hypothetical protein [Flammeovirgaceae bacterium]
LSKRNNLIVFLLVFGFLTACQEKRKREAFYYPVDSLLSAQIDLLSDGHALLNKEASINGKTESTQYAPKDSSAWASELDIFFELDAINKPINKGSYQVQRNLNDVNSNLSVLQFTCTEDLPVASLKVFYLKELNQIKKLEAVYKEANSLYGTTGELSLEFQDAYNKPRLISYSIVGDQKMMLDDSVSISIRGTIQYPN